MSREDARARRAIAGVGGLLLIGYLGAMTVFPKADGRVLIGDAVHHYVQLRSAVFDRDLHFENEYRRIYRLEGGESGTEWITRDLTRTGHVRNYMPVGPAVLWAPAYLAAVLVQSLLGLTGAAQTPTGYERAFLLIPGLVGILAVTAAAWWAYRTARLFVPPRPALIGVLGVWLGSHALYYSLVSPAYSHAASMFATSLFLWRWLSTREEISRRHAIEWGALAGLAALMRWQDALLCLIVAVDVLRWRTDWSTRLSALAPSALACLVVFAPQMVVWMVLYGQPFAIPQGPAFMQWTSPHPIAVLFSDNHGLLTWAPLLLLSLFGLWRWLGESRGLRWPVIAVIVGSWYVNAAVADWWAGEAFGARRFLSLFPLFVLGLSVWIHRGAGTGGTRLRQAAVAALSAANGLLLLQYQVFMKGRMDISPYPHGAMDMLVTRFIVPFRLLAEWFS
jgi:hypothetical protein